MPTKKRTLTIREAARSLGIGLNAAYRAVNEGDIPSIQIGKRRRVPTDALDRLLAQPPVSAGKSDVTR
jgi:excisionase family DNA binding protein